ncbi:MAG: hypothetical protein V1881_02720 [Candidatus Micrarchaeota archaeon]
MDNRILLGIGILVILAAAWFFFRLPEEAAPSPTPSPSVETSPTPTASPTSLAAKNLDPTAYGDSTAGFMVELANAIKEMVK